MTMKIWCNKKFNEAALGRLRAGLGGHTLALAAAGPPDPGLTEAEVAFGQPTPDDCRKAEGLRWVQLSSAGYTRYDREEVREEFRRRGVALTNSSAVFADPCAQHLLSMMLALNRRLLPAYRAQLSDRAWLHDRRGPAYGLLTGQTVVLLGFGAIGRRLAELLAPFSCTVYAVRRQARSESAVRVVSEEDLTRVLPLADHLVDVLPENESTKNWVNARRLACLRPSARFYNIGRGTTVDQAALLEALRAKRLAAAYLDVTAPEPLPPESPLWAEPNCFVTPHVGGARPDEDEAVVGHFLRNLEALARGAPLADRVL